MTAHHGSGEGSQVGKEPAEPSMRSVEHQKEVEDLREAIEGLRQAVDKQREDLQKAKLDKSKENQPSLLERVERIAVILGVPIALLGILITFLGFAVAAYSFTYTGEIQAEDAANHAMQEHMNVRTDLDSDMAGWLYTLRDSPEQTNASSQVTNSTSTQFDNVADRGLSTVEWIYRTRVEREPVEGFRPFEDALSELGLRDTDKDVG